MWVKKIRIGEYLAKLQARRGCLVHVQFLCLADALLEDLLNFLPINCWSADSVYGCLWHSPLCTSYDTIRDAILTCTRKLTSVSLIYRTVHGTNN